MLLTAGCIRFLTHIGGGHFESSRRVDTGFPRQAARGCSPVGYRGRHPEISGTPPSCRGSYRRTAVSWPQDSRGRGRRIGVCVVHCGKHLLEARRPLRNSWCHRIRQVLLAARYIHTMIQIISLRTYILSDLCTRALLVPS